MVEPSVVAEFVVTLAILTVVLAVATRFRRLRLQHERNAAEPRCKHGVRKRSTPACAECRKETENFFAVTVSGHATEVTGSVPWPKGDVVGVEWRKFKDHEPPPITPELKGFRCDVTQERRYPYGPTTRSAWCSAKTNSKTAFDEACRTALERVGAQWVVTQDEILHEPNSTALFSIKRRYEIFHTVVVEPEPTPKFKVGQWVRIVGYPQAKYNNELHVVESVEINPPGDVQYRLDRVPGVWASTRYLELATPRAGEWWQKNCCARPEHQEFDGETWSWAPLMWNYTYGAIQTWDSQRLYAQERLAIECGCLVPVNFGRGV